MKLTLGQSAKHIGCSKATISRAIKEGRLSASKREDGSYSIDPAELHRYAENADYRIKSATVTQPLKTPQMKRRTTPDETGETPNKTGEIEVEVEVLREKLKLLHNERERERQQLAGQIEDLRRRLDLEGEERRRMSSMLLTYQEQPKPEKQGFRKRLARWIAGK